MDTSFVTIENDEECANEIRDWMMDTQMQIGFDINYALTSDSRLLEELIDVFIQDKYLGNSFRDSTNKEKMRRVF